MTARLQEVISLIERFEREPEHVDQVKKMALALFDQLEALHGLGKTDREILEAAALLHDIGWSEAPLGRRHHKIAYKMIRDQKWKHWDPREIEIVANVARYHRKADPNVGHRPFAKLRPVEQSRVLRLSALLRLADGLDRSHRSVIQDLRCRVTADRVTLEVLSEADISVERECLPRKSALFGQIYGREVRFA